MARFEFPTKIENVTIRVSTENSHIPSADLFLGDKMLKANNEQYGIFDGGCFTTILPMRDALKLCQDACRKPEVTEHIGWYSKMCLNV